MRYGHFRGKFIKYYRWLYTCTDSCDVCSLYINGKCCNYYVIVPGKRFFIR